MRVLALNNVNTGELTVFEAIDVNYNTKDNSIEFIDHVDDCLYISNISLDDYNYICRKLAADGYCDVTRYGEIFCRD